MVKVLLLGLAVALPGCGHGSSGDTPTSGETMSTQGQTTTQSTSFRPVGALPYEKEDPPERFVSLAVPVRRATGLRFALFFISMGPVANPHTTPEERELELHSVSVPDAVAYFDPRTHVWDGSPGYLNQGRPSHFGIPDPPKYFVGRWDDPKWPSKDRRDLLRARIFAAMDVLLPLFDDPSRPWTEQANQAAREVRDFFPVAAEPGLWPYYKAEGREFFTWVEKNAPPAKVPLPWEPVTP